MKISLNEIKKYVKIPEDVSTDDLIKLIGSRLVEVEEAIDLAPKYAKSYVVKVAECEPIPGTHLHLCQIDAGNALGDSRQNSTSADSAEVTTEQIGATPVTTGGRDRCPQSGDFEQENRLLHQVVCGAPNVRKGMLAVWLAPGAIVPQTYGEENFKLGVRKLQGHESNGMLAGLDELDLGDDHSGIVELDSSMDFPGTTRNIQPGDSFAEAFELNDIILDIENKSLTHRPDTFGLVGFAREVAGILGIEFNEPNLVGDESALAPAAELSAPRARCETEGPRAVGVGSPHPSGPRLEREAAGAKAGSSKQNSVQIKIADKAICPRYTCAVIEMSDATKTTKYLTPDAVFLAKAGMRAINKIVDVTNILMLKTGQPLHAFDYDKFIKVGGTKSPKVSVRLAKDGEELQLLDGKTIKCTPDDILITSNNIPVALAGAMGGASTEIDASTKKVFLESATFSLYNLRKTQMHHGIFSEAITRFTKGQPAGQTLPVLSQAIQMLGGELITTADAYPGEASQPVVKITTSEINSLLGTDYSCGQIEKTLRSVGLEVSTSEGGNSAMLSTSGSSQTAPWDAEGASLQRERTIGSTPATAGGATGARSDNVAESTDRSENMLSVQVPYWRTDLHIKEDIIEEVGRLKGFDNIPKTFPARPFIGAAEDPLLKLKKQIRSIMSDNLHAHELLTYTFVNKKLQQNVGEDPSDSYEIVNSISPDLQVLRQSLTPSLLEKTHLNLKAGYKNFTLYEMNQVTKKSYGKTEDRVPKVHHHLAVVTTGDYYQAKALLAALLSALGIKDPEFTKFQTGAPYFEPLHSATVQPAAICLGEIRASVLRNLKISQPISAFEINLEKLLELSASAKSLQLSKYPSVERDLTLKVPASAAYAEVHSAINSALARQENLIFTLAPASIYQKEPKTKNLSFRLTFASTKKTLESSEISAIMEEVVGAASQLGAKVV